MKRGSLKNGRRELQTLLDNCLLYTKTHTIQHHKNNQPSGQRTWINIFSEEDTVGQETHEKLLSITNHHKWKSKPQYLEWLSAKGQHMTSIGEGVYKGEFSCSVCGCVIWCSHSVKQYENRFIGYREQMGIARGEWNDGLGEIDEGN